MGQRSGRGSQDETRPKSTSAKATTEEHRCLPRRAVKSIDDLKPADHIAFYRGCYWHHAIVVGIDKEKKTIELIHYYNTAKGWSHDPRFVASVIRTSVGFDEEKFFVSEYEQCLDDEEVIRRAEEAEARGKKGYCPFTNNCEHFAVECKKGERKSLQAEIVRNGVFMWLVKGAFSTGIAAFKSVLGQMAILSMEVAGGLLGAVVDLGYASYRIYRNYEKLQGQEITKREFEDSVGITVSIALNSLTGSILGAIVGQLVIPYPLVGSVVGAVVGNICGNVFGFLEGIIGSAVRMAWDPI